MVGPLRGGARPRSCVIKILFYEVCRTIFAKKDPAFIAKNWREKNGQHPFQAFLRLKKKKKKVAWTTKPLGWEQNLSGPTKFFFFMCVFPKADPHQIFKMKNSR